MFFYKVAILGRKSPPLIYCSEQSIQPLELVSAPLKTGQSRGVVLEETQKPIFNCKEIKPLRQYFTPLQGKLAYFIAPYYFSTLGESFGLFTPLEVEYTENNDGNMGLQSTDTFVSNICLKNLSSIQAKFYTQILPLKNALLFGDTGSGKSEIYFHLIAHTLKHGGDAILLMPEISLTPQMEFRLRESFGEICAIWHSKISKKKKQEIIRGLQDRTIRIIAGARSALFLPYKNLQRIIVDEEHDDAYKSQQTPFYNAKDLALWLSAHYPISTLLGSATPSVSSYHKLHERLFRLKGGYFKESGKNVRFIIGGDEPKEETLQKIQETLDKNKQVIIFLPTRANFKYITCPECAKTLQCDACAITMSYYEKEQKICCHHCNSTAPAPKYCPYCKGDLILRRIGTTELCKRLKEIFKQTKIERLDRDCIQSTNHLKQILDDFNQQKIQILIGTQMISKGHDYHAVGLVVILGIDYVLRAGSDYRSREKVMALTMQLCGRSGRKERGEVWIQSAESQFFMPYLGKYDIFLDDEINLRGEDYPPLSKIALFHIKHKNHHRAKEIMEFLLFLSKKESCKILSAGPCEIEKLQNYYRFFILITSKSAKTLHQQISSILASATKQGLEQGKWINVDIDPLHFL
ncbi:primosomal protein N' [Helicobacter monodelphidis]|uniref:replication restart helicase PriA n=1 Tax=Helicobacter sp. 15-1451 TaxID=2004995 RepID=UPI000DCE8E2A|nr:primosomal protein N' [Helicobacter sp. 15-1451]RAX57685.1 primosomal protein N' [Helicobacter sp. 15-1451]